MAAENIPPVTEALRSSRAPQAIAPKIDLSHISKPGDVMKAILAKKKEEEEEARHAHLPARPAAPQPVQNAPAPVLRRQWLQHRLHAPARPEPRRIVPQPRSAPPIIAPPPATPAIATKPPAGTVVAKAPRELPHRHVRW